MNYIKKARENTSIQNSLKNVAIFSVMIYIIFSTAFDRYLEFARLSSLSIYFCLICCGFYILSTGIFRINFYSGMLLIVGAVLVLSSFYTPAGSGLVNMYLYRYFTTVILITVVMNVVSDKEDLDRILDAFIIGGVLLSLILYSAYGISTLMSAENRLITRMGDSNFLGMNCMYAIVFSVYKMAYKRKRNLYYIITALICFPAVMFTGSRTSIMTLIVALMAFSFTYFKNRMWLTRMLCVILVLIIAVAVIYYVPAFQVIEDRFSSFFETINGDNNAETAKSDQNRIRYIIMGFKEFLKSPILGNGFCYTSYFFGAYSHNNYVELLANGGLILFFAFYSIHSNIVLKFTKRLKTKQNRKYTTLSAMIIFAVLFSDFLMVSYYVRHTLMVLMVCFIAASEKDGLESHGVEAKNC